MRVLLLGADGFLGRHVTDRLLADPAVQLTALGRRDSADVRFDLSTGSPGALARFLDAIQPGVVINCAGATVGSARDLVRANTVAVATVCEAVRRSTCTARLVQIGSAAEYGPSPVGSSTGEEALPRPNGAYGVSKLAASELVLGSGLDAVVLRVFTPVGPGTPLGSPLGRIADALRRAMQAGDSEVRIGGLSALRDFVDVRDVARAVHAASLSAAQGVVNIGTGHAVRLRDAAAALARAAGFSGQLLELDDPGELSVLPRPAAGRELRAAEPGRHHLPGGPRGPGDPGRHPLAKDPRGHDLGIRSATRRDLPAQVGEGRLPEGRAGVVRVPGAPGTPAREGGDSGAQAGRPCAGATSGPYPSDGCGAWQQADVRTARDRLGWRARIALEESLADVWMEAACRV